MGNWLNENIAVLMAALIGVLGTLLGVIITSCIENKRRRKELIFMNIPIIVNWSIYNDSNAITIALESEGEYSDSITGVFKNTNNGIAFIDYVKTETKTYYPVNCSTVDKNTVFNLLLRRIGGETLKKCTIFCHDVFGNSYYYTAHFCFDTPCDNQIILEDSIPIRSKKHGKGKS